MTGAARRCSGDRNGGPVRLRRIGRVVSLAGAGCAVLAGALGSPGLAVFAVGAALAVAVSWSQARLAAPPTVEVVPVPALVERRRAAAVELRWRRRRPFGTAVRLATAVAGRPVEFALDRTRRAATVSVAVPTMRRGVVRIDPVEATVTGWLGLAGRTAVVSEPTEVLVHPRIRRTDLPADAGDRSATRTSVGADELDLLRPYVPGDDPRHVHWRSSARVGELRVRSLVHTVDPPLEVVVDDAGCAAGRLETLLERAAGAVVAAEGRPLVLLTTSGRSADVRGRAGRRRALAVLAEVRPDGEPVPAVRVPPARGPRTVLR